MLIMYNFLSFKVYYVVSTHYIMNIFIIFKDLIKLLQDQLTDSEKKDVLQQFDGISGEDLEGNAATTLQTEENIVVVDPPSRYPADGASMSRLRDLSRTARSSNCFGSRLDRIGTWSGLGCNTMRWGKLPNSCGDSPINTRCHAHLCSNPSACWVIFQFTF